MLAGVKTESGKGDQVKQPAGKKGVGGGSLSTREAAVNSMTREDEREKMELPKTEENVVRKAPQHRENRNGRSREAGGHYSRQTRNPEDNGSRYNRGTTGEGGERDNGRGRGRGRGRRGEEREDYNQGRRTESSMLSDWLEQKLTVSSNFGSRPPGVSEEQLREEEYWEEVWAYQESLAMAESQEQWRREEWSREQWRREEREREEKAGVTHRGDVGQGRSGEWGEEGERHERDTGLRSHRGRGSSRATSQQDGWRRRYDGSGSRPRQQQPFSERGEWKERRGGENYGGWKERRGENDGGWKERRGGENDGGWKERRGENDGGWKERRGGENDGGWKERRGENDGGWKERRGENDGGWKKRRGGENDGGWNERRGENDGRWKDRRGDGRWKERGKGREDWQSEQTYYRREKREDNFRPIGEKNEPVGARQDKMTKDFSEELAHTKQAHNSSNSHTQSAATSYGEGGGSGEVVFGRGRGVRGDGERVIGRGRGRGGQGVPTGPVGRGRARGYTAEMRSGGVGGRGRGGGGEGERGQEPSGAKDERSKSEVQQQQKDHSSKKEERGGASESGSTAVAAVESSGEQYNWSWVQKGAPLHAKRVRL